jgi:hypothetical protein
MTDTPTASAELIVGKFPLVTARETIVGAYQDDREITVICDTGSVYQEFTAVFRLSDLPFNGYRGHTTGPEGFSLLYYEKDERPWIEISPR